MNASLIELKGVTKTFNGVTQALDGVSISIDPREIVGVVGENGAGKSTLMKIIAGVFPPDRGEWFHQGIRVPFPKDPKEAAKRGVSIVYQEKGIIPALKVYQYLFLGHEDRYIKLSMLQKKKMRQLAGSILTEFHINCDVDDFLYELPLSVQKMVEIARAILGLRLEHGDDTPSVIILDEPTAPLTIEERRELFECLLKMKANTSFVFVSHIMHEVLEFTDRIYVLRDGKLVGHHDLSREKLSAEDLFRAIVGKDSLEYAHKLAAKKAPDAEVVLSVKDLSRRGSYYGLSFDLRRGECIGIFGPAGSGKSEIVKTIAGLIGFDDGTLIVKGHETKAKESTHARLARGIGYFSGETEKQLVLNWPIRKNISLVNMKKILRKHTKIINFGAEKSMAENIVRKFRIKAQGINVDCRSLSGGNKQKVSVGKWFERRPDILLLEDPTIGIDVGAREDIYEATLEMKNSGISLILVSDDPKEYTALCDKIIFVNGGRIERVADAVEFKEAMAT